MSQSGVLLIVLPSKNVKEAVSWDSNAQMLCTLNDVQIVYIITVAKMCNFVLIDFSVIFSNELNSYQIQYKLDWFPLLNK